MSRETRVGAVAAVYALVLAVFTAVAVPAPLLAPSLLLAGLASDETVLPAAVAALLLLALAVVVLGAVTAKRALGLRKGTEGRTRLLSGSLIGPILAITSSGATALAILGVRRALSTGFVTTVTLGDAAYALPSFAGSTLWALLIGAFALLPVVLVSLVSAWFLVPRRRRRALWLAFDVLLLVAFVAVTVTLPLEPEEGLAASKVLAGIRLAVTAFFALRVALWALPPALDLVESIGYRPLVAARHLRAKKSNFLATIGALSVLAVASSSCSLTTTLSVMGGFRNDLKRKILGNDAHLVVDREHATFEGWVPLVERVTSTPGVVAASPYVHGEVMVTSASNLAGAVLRGIDPDLVKEVTDLQGNMRRGRLEYLSNPEAMRDLPTEQIRELPLETPPAHRGSRDDGPAPAAGAGAGAGAVRDIEELLGQPADAVADVDADPLGDGGARFDPLGDTQAPAAEPSRDLLPGIIVGQELARTLRLYVGDEVNVVSPLGDLGPSGPMPKSRPFRVAGIFYTGMYQYDMKYAYVLLETAQRFLNTGDAISGIEVKVRDVEQAPQVAEAVRRSLDRSDLRVRDWQELNKNLFGALALEKLAMFITLGIAILVAGFCVFGTLTLLVQEKGREVGILKAMGAPSRSIVAVFMIEGLLIGLLGSAVGLAIGYVVCFAAEHFGIQMNPEVYYIDKLPVSIDGVEFALVGLASSVVCLVATIFPAVLASRMRPVDALRYD